MDELTFREFRKFVLSLPAIKMYVFVSFLFDRDSLLSIKDEWCKHYDESFVQVCISEPDRVFLKIPMRGLQTARTRFLILGKQVLRFCKMNSMQKLRIVRFCNTNSMQKLHRSVCNTNCLCKRSFAKGHL